MTPNFDALRRHAGYFWIILGFRCMMASALILLGGTLVLQSFTSEQPPPVVIFIFFGSGFIGGGLILAGGYTAWDLVAREFAVNPGTYLDSVSGAISMKRRSYSGRMC